ncbi:MAG: hypothetical protein NTV79_05365, partial [Candidatus Aureabacteria bacterium]|nr:hypothetical protein [Candidatus Auribacterota bacterium]
GKRVVVRRYRHGVICRVLTGDLFRGPERPLRELKALELARGAGIPVPLALGVFLEPAPAGFIRADLVTEYIPDTIDLLACFRERGGRGADADAIVRAAGRLVARAHQAGMYHSDLNLKNVLIGKTVFGTEAYLLDLDQSFFRPPLSRTEKERNLLRLYRSYRKMVFPERADPRPAIRFLLAYAPREREFRRSFVRRAERSGSRCHRLRWWWRERVFGSRYARPRD